MPCLPVHIYTNLLMKNKITAKFGRSQCVKTSFFRHLQADWLNFLLRLLNQLLTRRDQDLIYKKTPTKSNFLTVLSFKKYIKKHFVFQNTAVTSNRFFWSHLIYSKKWIVEFSPFGNTLKLAFLLLLMKSLLLQGLSVEDTLFTMLLNTTQYYLS